MDGNPADHDIRTMGGDLLRIGYAPDGGDSGLLPGLAAGSPRERGRRTKIVIIVFLAIAVLAVGGGSFYYFQIYQPTRYARAVIRIYDAMMAEGMTSGRGALRDDADYAGALDVVRKQRLLAEQIKGELALLKPPPTMADSARAFENFLDMNLAAVASAELQATFFKTAADFRAEMKKITAAIQPESQPTGAGQVRPPPAPTAGAVRAVWEEAIPRLQSLGNALFTKAVSGFSEPSYAELAAAWQKAGPGLPFLLDVIRKINPEARLNTIPENLSKAELDRSGAAFGDIGKFSDLLNTALSKASAIDLLSLRAFSQQAELSELNFQLMQTVEGLRGDYGPR